MRLLEFTESKTDIVNMFRKFLPLSMEILELDSLPKFVFEQEIDTGSQPSFGMYDADNRVLYVALANRHPVDILRTVAHELVHYKQDLLDQLHDDSGQTGSPEENQANELAGVILRNFNKRYPEFLKIKPLVLESRLNFAEGSAPPLPKVLYHGGPKSITKFNTPPQGVYFSPHLTHAQGYGDVVTAARVNANNVYLIDYENDIDEEIMDALFDMDYKRVAKYIKLLQKQGYDAMQSISDSEMVVVFPGTPIQVIDNKQGIEHPEIHSEIPTENFADGKNPQDRGDSARHGIRKGMTIAQLKKIRSSDSASPRKKQLAHWQINMRQSKKK